MRGDEPFNVTNEAQVAAPDKVQMEAQMETQIAAPCKARMAMFVNKNRIRLCFAKESMPNA